MKSIDEKLLWVDYLRAFATISVILLHTTAPILYQYGSISKYDWWIGNIFDSSVRFCVPIFLMLSGTLILPKIYKLQDFLKKRASRIIYPFIFWSLIYVLFKLTVKWHNGNHMNTFELSKFIFILMKNGASYHFWYIYVIIGIYLIFPVTSKWIVNSTTNEIAYYIVVWILLNIPYFTKIKPNLDLTYFSGFLGYPILGYFLNVVNTNKKARLVSYILISTGILTTIVGTYILTKLKGFFVEYFYSYLSLNVIIVSAGIYILFKNLELKNEKLINICMFISKYSYGIYLSHVLVLWVLSKVGISLTFINPIIGIPLTTILCLAISSYLIYLINKMPFGTFISG